MFDLSETASRDLDDEKKLRKELLETTVRLLREEGPSALKMRRLADECDTSTYKIYSTIGGKTDLILEIFEVGEQFLEDRLKEVSRDLSPVARLYRLGRVYRDFALENQALYDAIHSQNAPEGLVGQSVVFDLIKEVVESCVEDGVLPEDVDPEQVTRSLCAAAHGAVSLEITGFYDSNEQKASEEYDEAIRTAFDGYRVDDPTELPR
jgi:AcrR family transcriptional regulator